MVELKWLSNEKYNVTWIGLWNDAILDNYKAEMEIFFVFRKREVFKTYEGIENEQKINDMKLRQNALRIMCALNEKELTKA